MKKMQKFVSNPDTHVKDFNNNNNLGHIYNLYVNTLSWMF